MYMISCNDMKVSLCSISCPLSVERTCLWFWSSTLNWILYDGIDVFALLWNIKSHFDMSKPWIFQIPALCQGWEYCIQNMRLAAPLMLVVAVSSLLWFTFSMFTKFFWQMWQYWYCFYSIWADTVCRYFSEHLKAFADRYVNLRCITTVSFSSTLQTWCKLYIFFIYCMPQLVL